MFRLYGFGLVNRERALGNNPHRITFYTPGQTAISPWASHVFKVPIPRSIRAPGQDSRILVEVTLVYSAKPKRTRKYSKRYFSTWVDWQTNKLDESLSDFSNRVLESDGTSSLSNGETFPWMIGTRSNIGQVSVIRRGSGPVQKDWAIVRSYNLPELEFLISVTGHEGWSKDPEHTANYSLFVSFESLESDLEIYNPIKVEVDNLEATVDV